MPNRALIVDPAFLGDVVFDGPLVRALLASGVSDVGMVVRPPADRIAARFPGIGHVHVFDKRRADRGLAGLERIAEDVARVGYDTAYVVHPSLRSALVPWWAGVPRRVGVTRGIGRWLLTERIGSGSASTGFVRERLRLAGLESVPGDLRGTLRSSPKPASGKRRIGLLLGSEWATKRWSAEQSGAFVRQLNPEREVLVLLGAAFERPLYEVARSAAPSGLEVEDGLEGDLDDLLERLSTCDVVVGGDTGPLHAARAFGIPSVALFGPTPPHKHDWAAQDAVLTVDLPCRPCSPHGGRVCPEGHHRCMKELEGGRVARAARHAAGGDAS